MFNKRFGVALIEKPGDEGMSRSEVMDLYDMLVWFLRIFYLKYQPAVYKDPASLILLKMRAK